MARKAAIQQLPKDIQDQVHRLIRDGRTVDQITAKLQELDAEVSRSSVGRYKQKYEASLKRYREAQEVAAVWVNKLGEDPKGDVGRLIAEMLKTVAFQTLADMGDQEAAPTPMDLHFIGRMIKDVEQAGKIAADRELQIKRKLTELEAEAASEGAAGGGLDPATLERVRQHLGLT